MEESKTRDFYVHGGSILVCSPSVENALELLPSCDPPLGERTHSYGNLPYNIENALGLLPSCDPPLGEPTHMGTSYNIENALGLPSSCDPPLGEPTHMGTSPSTLRIQTYKPSAQV
jgi:hypothetical protein